jgi:4-amino-4-deoxy-L-arabinose transferase-like glycosyltransferase
MSKNTSLLLFTIGLFVFVFLRMQYNYLAFHWDEMWSYVPAVRTMHENGISLLPSSMNPDISRGHPLFFYALNASFLKILGTSNSALHTLPLIISCICMYATYLIGSEFFSPKVGIVSSLLLMVQSMFFVQSAMVLPEVMIATLVLLAFYAFFKEKIYLYFFFTSLLVLTKESGIVLPAALATCYFFKEFDLRNIDFWKKIAWIIAPLSTFALFLLVQKMTFGWFFFPEHVGMMHLDVVNIKGVMKETFNYAFVTQNRRNVFAYGSLIVLLLFLVNKKFRFAKPKNIELTLYFLTFILFYAVFCSVNFFTVRYVLCLIPVGLLFIVALFFELTPPKQHFVPTLFFLFCMFTALNYTIKGRHPGDDELGAFDFIDVQAQAVSAIEKYVPKDKPVLTRYGFLKNFALKTPYCGFLSVPYTKFDAGFPPNAIGYYLAVEPDAEYEKMKQEGKIEVLHRFEKNKALAEIYRVKE